MLDRVIATLDALSTAEKRVGKLLVEDPRRFVTLSAAEIANECFVSKPTIVRFCQRLGYGGLTQLKQKLGGELTAGVPFIHPSVDADDTTSCIALKVVDNSIAELSLFRSHAPTISLDQASSTLARAHAELRGVSFYGSGHSGLVAQDAQLRFARLGFNASACCDGYSQVVNATLRQAGDVVVAISNSGRTKELLESVDIARRQGATAIVLTGTGTPLATMGSIHLAADHMEDFDRYLPMSSRLLHLMVIDIVATTVALRIGHERLHEQLARTQKQLRHRRYA